MTAKPDLELMPDDERVALGYLAIMRDRGDLTELEFDRIGRALGLLPDPDVDNRPKRGHVRGVRGRALPVDWTRRGAVAG